MEKPRVLVLCTGNSCRSQMGEAWVRHLLGDRVEVRSGYGRNFLLPTGKATLATPDNIKKFDARRAELEKKAHAELQDAESRAARLKDFKLQITAKAGNEGKLFGSIGTADIAEAATAADLERVAHAMEAAPSAAGQAFSVTWRSSTTCTSRRAR